MSSPGTHAPTDPALDAALLSAAHISAVNPASPVYGHPDKADDDEPWADDVLELRFQLNQRTVNAGLLAVAISALQHWETQFANHDTEAIRLLERAQGVGRRLATERLIEADALLTRANNSTTPDEAAPLEHEALRLLDEATLLEPANAEAASMKAWVEAKIRPMTSG